MSEKKERGYKALDYFSYRFNSFEDIMNLNYFLAFFLITLLLATSITANDSRSAAFEEEGGNSNDSKSRPSSGESSPRYEHLFTKAPKKFILLLEAIQEIQFDVRRNFTGDEFPIFYTNDLSRGRSREAR